jgi:DNA polymerase-3 subunit beta
VEAGDPRPRRRRAGPGRRRCTRSPARSPAASGSPSRWPTPEGEAGQGLIGIEASGKRTTTRLLEGEFIKYNSIFPAEFAGEAVIETAALIEAVKRVALVAERNTPVRLSFSTGQVTLEAGTGDEARASETMDAVFEGEDISLAFNPGYLLEGLSALDAPYTQLSYTTSTKPAVLTGRPAADAEHDPAYRYLVMPIRLTG